MVLTPVDSELLFVLFAYFVIEVTEAAMQLVLRSNFPLFDLQHLRHGFEISF